MKTLPIILFTLCSFSFAQDCLSGTWLYGSGYDAWLQGGSESTDMQFITTQGEWRMTLEPAPDGYAATYDLSDFTPVAQVPVAGGPNLEVHVRMNGTGYATYQTEGTPVAGDLVIAESDPAGISVTSEIVMGGQVMPGFDFMLEELYTPSIITDSSYTCDGDTLELVIDGQTETPLVFSRASP